MKKILPIILISALMFFSTFSFAYAKISSIRGYVKPSTGRYVAPYFKTSPNKTKIDNFSTKGNINPFTGKKGTVNPFKALRFK